MVHTTTHAHQDGRLRSPDEHCLVLGDFFIYMYIYIQDIFKYLYIYTIYCIYTLYMCVRIYRVIIDLSPYAVDSKTKTLFTDISL